MFGPKLKIEIVEGTTEGISYSGEKRRRRTILLKVGEMSISKKAFEIGAFLAICQILDGLLTYLGLYLFGVDMEGNGILAFMIKTYGSFPALFVTKLFALFLVAFLTIYSHKRKWFRPVIALIAFIYLMLAIFPWTFTIASHVVQN